MKAISEALQWLEAESQNMRFGTIGFNAIVHDGKIVRVEKSLTQKEQFDCKSEIK
jgi:hypothetical protein